MKAFLENSLLPRVITGTSAGGLIAALACTRTDEELKVLLVPDLAKRLTACEEPFSVWVKVGQIYATALRFQGVYSGSGLRAHDLTVFSKFVLAISTRLIFP